tara:strand:- start:6663 stop:7010 length:348 start_codon:yes stop_codon:yes gene_type:complete
MAVTVTNAKRDGDLCVATFSITSGGGNATTAEDVVGHIKQIGVTNTAGVSNSFTFVLEDTASGMQLFSGTADSDDIATSGVNNGAGAYCRGPLKFSFPGTTPTIARAIEVFYEKL